MRYMSRAARKVVDYLNALGIIIEEPIVFYQIDVACSMWFPNHIIQVITKCLSGGDRAKKLFKAQELGWYYFAGPITKMLSKREEAKQPTNPQDYIDESYSPEHSAAVYGTVTTSLLAHDMNNVELNQLLYDVPPLVMGFKDGGRETVLDAIRICKERKARTIPYLHGILERRGSEIKARIKDRDEDQASVWKPNDDQNTIDSTDAAADWESKSKIIESLKSLNVKTTRRRRSP